MRIALPLRYAHTSAWQHTPTSGTRHTLTCCPPPRPLNAQRKAQIKKPVGDFEHLVGEYDSLIKELVKARRANEDKVEEKRCADASQTSAATEASAAASAAVPAPKKRKLKMTDYLTKGSIAEHNMRIRTDAARLFLARASPTRRLSRLCFVSSSALCSTRGLLAAYYLRQR